MSAGIINKGLYQLMVLQYWCWS